MEIALHGKYNFSDHRYRMLDFASPRPRDPLVLRISHYGILSEYINKTAQSN